MIRRRQNVNQKLKFVLGRAEYIVGKGVNAVVLTLYRRANL